MTVPLIQNSFHANAGTRQLVSNTALFVKYWMDYDEEFWNKYSDTNESRYNEAFAKFVRDLATSLRCTSVLEIGCGTGIDLRLFPDTFEIHGIDLNCHALEIAQVKLSAADFKKGDISKLPFADSAIDFVFTHGLMNYLDEQTLDKGVAEMFRVARKYIMNCERFDETERKVDENQMSRNMQNRWRDYKVRFVSNVDMHKDIEPDMPRFTLLKKL